jgi:iron complex transport system ATP-binding protein
MIEAIDLSFAYEPGKPILKNINWSSVPETVSVLAGVNGCGKSTLLKCLAGLFVPDKGEIRLDGVPLKKIPVKQRAAQVAYLPQNPVIPESFTVRELLECSRYSLRDSAGHRREIIGRTMEDCGISGLAERQFVQLSGGEKQRALLAFVLVRDARILLLDEPFSALDPAAFRELFSLLIRLKKERSISVVTVLHDINRALNYGDRIVGIKNGAVQFDLTPKAAAEKVPQLYDLPDNSIVNGKFFL